MPLLKSVLSKLFCLSDDFCCPCCSLTFSFLCLKGVRFCATLLTGYQLPDKDCKRKFLFCFLTRFLLPLASICYPIVIIFSGLCTKRTGCNSWKMHLQETKPKHCHHFPLTEIYNHSKERAKKVILFISSFEACSTVAEVLLTDTPPAELNIFCFITASSMLPLSNSPTINTTQSVKNIFFFCRCGNLHCYSSAVLNLENPKKASVVEHKQLQKGSCCSEGDYGTDGKLHSLSHCGPSLTASMQKAGKAS